MQAPSFSIPFLACLTLGSVLLGCASAKHDDAPNTSLDALAKGSRGPTIQTPKPQDPSDITSLAEQAALDLQQVIDSGALTRSRRGPNTSIPNGASDATQADFVGPPAPPDIAAAAPSSDEPAATAEDALLELARRMASLLRSGPRIPDAVALAPIEAMEPGVLAELESPKSVLGAKLSPEDRQALTDARDRILAHPGAASESLTRTLAKLAPPPNLKIARAVLCTKVQGFGRYEPFNTDTFVVGQQIRAIVYIELEGFMTRPARSTDPVDPSLSVSDQVSVELSQSMTLFTDPSGLQAKYIPWQKIVDTSRNKRHDFYLIQQIDLSNKLTIGRYNLKIAIKDATSGSEVEASLPINIVADSSALTRLR